MKSDFREWSDIRVFLAVMREGSTLAASRRLGMSQPTVARRIDVLEHISGLRLFDRTTQGFCPTSAAEALLPEAERMEVAAEALARIATRERNAPSKPIRFSLAPVALTKNLTAILAKFRADHPGTSFEFMPTRDEVDLIGGEADMALRYALEIKDERLIRYKLSDIHTALFASESYVAEFGAPKSEDDLASHRFVFRDGRIRPGPIDTWLLDRITPDQIVSRSQDFESLFAAVQTGIGIGALPRVRAYLEGGFVECFTPKDTVVGHTWLVVSPAAMRRPEVKVFAEKFARDYAAFLAEEKARILPDTQVPGPSDSS